MEIMTIGEVAEFFKLNRRTITRMIDAGQLRGYKIGKSWRFNRTEVEDLMRETGHSPVLHGPDVFDAQCPECRKELKLKGG